MINNILFVIVLYKVKLEKSSSYVSLTECLKHTGKKGNLYVYDNTPVQQEIDYLNPYWNIEYIHDSNNSGISIAYNRAARYAESCDKKWLLFADQDTNFGKYYLKELVDKIECNLNINIFCPILETKNGVIVSPSRLVFMRGCPIKNLKTGIFPLKNISIINSGLCVSLDAFSKAGGYNENIKLDFSDHYFVSKLSKHNSHFCIVADNIQQDLSTFSDSHVKVVNRFRFYCNGAKYFLGKNNLFSLPIACTLRMLKLTYKYKDIRFFFIFCFYFIGRRKV